MTAHAHPQDWAQLRHIVLRRDGWRCQDCGERCRDGEAHVHHLIPRSTGGSDEPANLTTLCDGCHAARHPNLQVSLARRTIERWAVRLARFLDRRHELPEELDALSPALRLFGKSRLREGQLEAVLAALRGESVLVVRPTGSGKSLCFQLPSVLSDGTAFVLSPLKALMNDQVAHLQRLKLPGSFVNGDLGPDEKELRYELLEAGALKFFYCTPERFNPDRVRPEEVRRILAFRPAFLVVDEAHCVDRWGKDFRPDYDRIGKIREELGNPPVLAFTATAGVKAQHRILASLGVPDATRLISGVDRPNIALIRRQMPDDVTTRADFIATMLGRLGAGKAMLFVPTRKIGDALKSALSTRGWDLPFYHSQMGTANLRDMVIGRFTGRISPPLQAVICTNAFGMGLDVPDVRLVVNWQHPASVEDYLQEFGRAGRDGQPAIAILLTEGGAERGLLDFMAEKTVDAAGLSDDVAKQTLEWKKEQIGDMNALATPSRACFRGELINYLAGDRPEVRPSLAMRVMTRVFANRGRASGAEICCDACDPASVASLLGPTGRDEPGKARVRRRGGRYARS